MKRTTKAFLITPLVPPITFTLIFMFGRLENIVDYINALIFTTVLGAPIGYLIMFLIIFPLWRVINRLDKMYQFVVLALLGLFLGILVGVAFSYVINRSYIYLDIFVVALAMSGLVAAIVFWWLCNTDNLLKQEKTESNTP